MLLLAIAIDAGGHTLILAWGVVETESESTWGWFLSHLISAIPRARGQLHTPQAGQIHTSPGTALVGDTTMLSDRDKGLLSAIGALAPGVN